MTAGRPRKYDTPEDMQSDVDAYFAECVAQEKRPTVSGLAYRLDMATETLRSYGEQDKFTATVKKAKQRIEMVLEESLAHPACTGSIFNLKNNFGWKDKTEQEFSGSVEIAAIERKIV